MCLCWCVFAGVCWCVFAGGCLQWQHVTLLPVSSCEQCVVLSVIASTNTTTNIAKANPLYTQLSTLPLCLPLTLHRQQGLFHAHFRVTRSAVGSALGGFWQGRARRETERAGRLSTGRQSCSLQTRGGKKQTQLLVNEEAGQGLALLQSGCLQHSGLVGLQ